MITSSGVLPAQRIAELEQLLRKIGFLDLKNDYGEQGPADRSSREVFEIKLDGKSKTITFHHRPSAPPMPEELAKLRTALFKLVNTRFSLKDSRGQGNR